MLLSSSKLIVGMETDVSVLRVFLRHFGLDRINKLMVVNEDCVLVSE